MITLAELKRYPDIIEALEWPFDFSLGNFETDSDSITLKPSVPYEKIAEDGTSGEFIAYGENRIELLPILHATSEGQAGKIASNLTEWLGILTSIPYWRDLLKFSGNGQLSEMRIAAEFMEKEYAEEIPDLPEARKVILNQLAIAKIDDPIQALHSNVLQTDCMVVDEDGSEWDSLFNSFTAQDNPSW